MKNHFFLQCSKACVPLCILLTITLLTHSSTEAQSCPVSSTTTINAYTNTYYPGSQASVSAGATTIVLGNASTSGYGNTAISAWDIVLIIQMQGAQINSTNGTAYGDGTGTGSGYLNNAQLMAGQMEYAIATSAVPLTGGTLTVQSGLIHSYKNANFGTDGQYRYQVIRVPVYYNAILGANILPPGWNGAAGGVFAMYVSYNLNMNGKTIDASSAGFRGGGGKSYSNVGSGANTDYAALSSGKAGGSKGEGIAGTPLYLDSLNSTGLITTSAEGYPGGSYDRGAPGNAGGGATDGAPNPSNSNNAGGGGGGNGGIGGIGGNSWSSNLAVGGKPGALFGQLSPSRLVMGGGGGAGSSDGGTGTPGGGFASSGAPGGGIVIVTAGSISGTGAILANGAAPNTTLANDGSGGGGGGGSILIITGTTAPGLTVQANGSDGAGNTGAGAKHGPGGGGGGGIIYSNKTLGAVSVTGGAAGVTAGSVTYGAGAGAAGISSQTITISQSPGFPLTCNTLLSIAFLSASATSENGNITVSWQVTNEKDLPNYTIERSFDGVNFSVIATIAVKASGNDASNYSYTDTQAGDRSGLIYYRIKATDLNGQGLLSNILVVNQSLRTSKIRVTPNPVAGAATLSFMSDNNAGISVSLIDITGNSVWARPYQGHAGMNTLRLDHLQELPNGVYFLLLYNGEVHEKVKLLVRH